MAESDCASVLKHAHEPNALIAMLFRIRCDNCGIKSCGNDPAGRHVPSLKEKRGNAKSRRRTRIVNRLSEVIVVVASGPMTIHSIGIAGIPLGFCVTYISVFRDVVGT